jgi:hypothetical protein
MKIASPLIEAFQSAKRSDQARFIGELVLTGQLKLEGNPIVAAWNNATAAERREFRAYIEGPAMHRSAKEAT